MNKEQQIELIENLDNELRDIIKSKREDYGSEDVLSNFKQVSAAAKALNIDITNPTQYALFMGILKVARITNLMNDNKIPNNESLEDSFKDLINYNKLAYCNYKDDEKKYN
jgi:hypothetical protein